MKQTEFSWNTTAGARIHAVEWRPELAPKAVVALVHGLGEHCHRYEHMAKAYCEAGVAMLSFDLPGHGQSEGKRGHASYPLAMDQIDRLMTEAGQRFPGLPTFVYGHSLGGSLTLNWLLERKPRIAGAVITSPGLAPAVPLPAAKFAVAKLMARFFPSFTLENDLILEGLSRDPEVIRAYREDPLVDSQISARLGLDLIEAGPRITARAREIVLSLLLLQGGADRLVDSSATARFAAAAGDNVTYRVFEGHYHELHNEPDKDAFFAIVLGWISDRLGS